MPLSGRIGILSWLLGALVAAGVSSLLFLMQDKGLDAFIAVAIIAVLIFLFVSIPGVLIAQKVHKQEIDFTNELDGYRDQIDLTSDRVWETDQDFRFIKSEDKSNLPNYPLPQDILGKTRWEIGKGDIENDRNWVAHYSDHVNHRPFKNFIYSIVDHNGNKVHWNVSGRPIFTQTGDFVGFRGISRNITTEVENREALKAASRDLEEKVRHRTRLLQEEVSERVRTERALRDSNDRLKIVLENSADGIFIHDARGVIVDVNQQASIMTGYTREELLKLTVDQIDADHDKDMAKAVFDRAKNVGRILLETQHRHKNGKIYPVEVSVGFSQYGDDALFFATVRDISLRKAEEVELKKSMQVLRHMTDNLPVGAVFVESGKIRLNKTCEEITGFARHELTTVDEWFKALWPHDAQKIRDLYEHDRAIGFKVQRELEITTKSKKARQVVFSAYSSELGEVWILDDVTDRRRLEEQLAERQKLEAVGRLTGGVAHDFNNILQVILGNARELETSLANASEMENLRSIMSAGIRGRDLIRRMLAFSRRQILNPEKLNLNDCVESVEEILKRTLGEDIEIIFNLDKKLAEIEVDRSGMENTLLQLAINARDAMPDGGRLEISTGVETDQDGTQHVRLLISDNGVGMDESTLARAREPFFTTAEFGKATGLGLSMVDGFVDQSNGVMDISSTLGKGTKVSIEFPGIGGTTIQPDTTDTEPKGETMIQEQKPRTILVVEDDHDVRFLACRTFRREGFDVVEAVDANDAMKLVENGVKLDLIFSDFVMPGGMNGQQLIDEIRKTQPKIKAVITSGYPADYFDKHGTPLKGIDLLQKPYTDTELLNRVRSVILKP